MLSKGSCSKRKMRKRKKCLTRSEILGTLIKIFEASFLPFFDELSSYLTHTWGKDKTAEPGLTCPIPWVKTWDPGPAIWKVAV